MMRNPFYIIEPCHKNTETLLVFMSNMHSSKYLQKMNDEEAEIEMNPILQILG